MRRILYITVRSDYGGGPEHIHQLLKGLSASFKIYVACPDEEPYFRVFSKYAECIVVPHRKFSVLSLLELNKAVRKNRIDIVHSHGNGAGLYSRALRAKNSVKVVHTFHGVHHSRKGPLKKYPLLWLERSLSRWTDMYINVSESEREECLRCGFFSKKDSVVIPNGVEVPGKTPRKKSGNDFRIISVSRLSRIKGVDILLRIAKEITLRNRAFKLLVVGDGPERGTLERKARELGLDGRIEFLGFRDDVSGLLDSSDLFLSSSRGEGMPISVLEAMARSLPVVASDVSGNRDVVRDRETGFLFDLDSPEEAAKRVIELMDDEKLRRSMSEKAYSAVQGYSAEKMCWNMAKVYDALLSDKPGALEEAFESVSSEAASTTAEPRPRRRDKSL